MPVRSLNHGLEPGLSRLTLTFSKPLARGQLEVLDQLGANIRRPVS